MLECDVNDVTQNTSTGSLPDHDLVAGLVTQAHARYADLDEGAVADYILVLATADPKDFGLVFAAAHGAVHSAGDVDVAFSIQSISKAFVFALVCDAQGHDAVHEVVGVNNTGLAFDSVMALELNDGSPMNPMVNAGAIATTAMIAGRDAEEQWQVIRDGLSRFAGRALALDGEVYESESFSNFRKTLPTILGLVVFGVGQGALVTLVFTVLVTAAPKSAAGDVGSIRGTTQNLASAVGTAVMGAVLVTLLTMGFGQAMTKHPELPAEIAAEIQLDEVNFISNDELREKFEQSSATKQQIDKAVEINEQQRLRSLKLGFLLLAGLSAIAALPASRLPRYRPHEIPDRNPARESA